jgi:predicted ABC-type ATPase
MPGSNDRPKGRSPQDDPVPADEPDPDDAGLQELLEQLALGHPSSPYNADGSRKPPPPDLSDYELPIPGDPDYPSDASSNVEPLTDAEYAEHVRDVRQRLDQARSEGLATDKQYTLDRRGEIWLEERTAHHIEIVNELYGRAATVPAEHQAVMAGGLPGAGKTTVLDNYAGIDRSRFLTIDPDEIKSEMARRGLIPHVEGLSPMETSDLVHDESSHIAKRLANVVQAEGKNLIWDISMLSRPTTEQRINELRSNGYTHIEAIFVDIPSEVSKARAEARHRAGQEEYRAGKGEGGRLIPADLIDRNSDPVWDSGSRKTFEEVKHRFDRWSVYDNSADGLPPVLTHSSEMEERRQ